MDMVSVILVAFFFVNDTATTEIYTYRHTLSRHDALPISGNLWLSVGINTGVIIGEDLVFSVPDSGVTYTGHLLAARLTRSEEHTSELQSLMRISYAVFCLTKKTYTEYDHTSHRKNHTSLHTHVTKVRLVCRITHTH